MPASIAVLPGPVVGTDDGFTMRRRSTVTVFMTMFTVLACDIFETREPESPTQAGSNFRPPTQPEVVLDNLQNAISERNTENYLRSFVDSTFSSRQFEFIPTQEAQSRYFTVFLNWSLDLEREYFENLRSQTVPSAFSTLIFNDGRFESLQSDSAEYNANYRIVFQHNRPDTPTEAEGTVLFYLSTDSRNNWAIHRWVDFKTGSDFSWSELKGRFSN